MSVKTVRLFLCPVPSSAALTVGDAAFDEPIIHFENIKECLTDASCDKMTYFAELKQEQALFMKKLYRHMVLKSDGNYNKHHVLFDLMIMYKTYVQLADESAFGSNVLNYCEQFITGAFELFGLGSRIEVLVPPGWENDNLSVLLKHLHGLNLIAIDIVQ
ncbi:unknown [Choristoneura fumiferana DEF multiple nucleopolyhedrovirus]|uniref:P18 n=1 Tax=Choristoneura fumiferana defective polyhedrosis virus TaxID=74660 RepID=Q6VTQ3_NPVCD|nr:hypothetical protein CFDNVgORF86 [Choristoneura fumiferana DEF multiple nucleopolyhedrovirus]AAQ91732.1 unknown [Choristoneura fumiferana DEF multiple nucleopolyhedrovirus]